MPPTAVLNNMISNLKPEQGKVSSKEIMDSLRYARLIQQALLPPPELIARLLDEYFIYYQPKSLVSGDFYWVAGKNDHIYIVTADCTGHGIPGALMSILGITLINDVVRTDNSRLPNRILNALREKVMEALHQTGEFNESKDGMDMSLCIINKEKSSLHYAGANNPLYIIRDNNLIEVKGDKMPVGINAVYEEPFTGTRVDIFKNDRIYLFSDGYPDQFGGSAGKKFKYRPFKKMLIDIHQKNMSEQHDILHETIKDWTGDNEQVDDILVMGLTIT